MDKLRELAPWQLIALSVGVLLVVLLGGYFAVTTLTTSRPSEPVRGTIPADLNSSNNQQTVKSLEKFTAPSNLPILTDPLRTPDPNAPSTVNPFQR